MQKKNDSNKENENPNTAISRKQYNCANARHAACISYGYYRMALLLAML